MPVLTDSDNDGFFFSFKIIIIRLGVGHYLAQLQKAVNVRRMRAQNQRRFGRFRFVDFLIFERKKDFTRREKYFFGRQNSGVVFQRDIFQSVFFFYFLKAEILLVPLFFVRKSVGFAWFGREDPMAFEHRLRHLDYLLAADDVVFL